MTINRRFSNSRQTNPSVQPISPHILVVPPLHNGLMHFNVSALTELLLHAIITRFLDSGLLFPSNAGFFLDKHQRWRISVVAFGKEANQWKTTGDKI